MITRAFILSFILSCQALGALSQESEQTPANRAQYYNRTFTGILTGGQHGMVTGSLLTSHGVSIGKLALAAGVGLEGYERWRTVPIFGSLSYHFRGARRDGLFLQVNGGHAICRLLTDNEGININGTKGGAMFSSTLGYQIAAKNLLVNIAAGYKMQKMHGNFSGFLQPLAYTIDEKANRFIFQIGFGIL